MQHVWWVNSKEMIEGKERALFIGIRAALRAIGYSVGHHEEGGRPEFAVCFRKKQESVPGRRAAALAGIPTLFIENGWFMRVETVVASQPERYLQACWDDLCRLSPIEVDVKDGRYDEARFGTIKPKRTPDTLEGKPLLILGQVPEDAQHGMFSEEMERWYQETVREEGNGRAVFRPHPKNPTHYDQFRALEAMGGVTVDTDTPLPLALARCGGVAALNSTALFEALQAGVPIVKTLGNGMFAGMTGPRSWGERAVFLERVARHQWTSHELAQPVTWLDIILRKP